MNGEWWTDWWNWALIVGFTIWVFTVRGFSGLGQPSDPPFGQVWTKAAIYVRKRFGTSE